MFRADFIGSNVNAKAIKPIAEIMYPRILFIVTSFNILKWRTLYINLSCC